jgi:glutaredoxin-like YruB-family protein
VELFTTSWCPWCKKAREYFTTRGIRFTDYDIEKDAEALKRKVGLDGGTSVPTAIIGAKVIKGYSPSGYQAALEQP